MSIYISSQYDGYSIGYTEPLFGTQVSIVKSPKTEGAREVAAASWQLPATTAQLHRLDQGPAAADVIEKQIIGLRNDGDIILYRVDFVSNHRPEHETHDRVDMLVVSSLLGKDTRTLTYWTDFETEIILPKAPASSKLFAEDLLKPRIVVIGGAEGASAVVVPASVSSARHSWPAVRADQKDLVRMEATENGEWKFWSIWKNGTRVLYHHGRIGEPSGNEGAYVSSSVRAAGGADAFMQRKIAEKQRKGYVKV